MTWTKTTLEQDSKKGTENRFKKIESDFGKCAWKNKYGIMNYNDTDNKAGLIQNPQNLTISDNSASYDQVDCPT